MVYNKLVDFLRRGLKVFKSTFSKYLIAFILIIFISFIMLSGIITSMIRTYVTEEKESELVSTTTVIAQHIEKTGIENIKNYVDSEVASLIIAPIINRDKSLEIIITDKEGNILLSTLNSPVDETTGMRVPYISGNLGEINISSFQESESGCLFVRGTLNGLLSDSSAVYANDIYTNSEIRGYVLSLYSSQYEDNIIALTRRAVINSSAWVMLAAVIAVYFITERIIHPLRNMTAAAKKFGKGDFSTRVTVYGTDEVSQLAIAFNNMADSLGNLEKMRNSFLSNVSHDLRTPMTTIAGFIDGIRSGAIPPEKQDYYLQTISSEIHRLSRLVSQLLDISRLESGDRKMSFQNFDVAEVARIILISFEQKIDEKKLDVEFETEDEEMLVYADKDSIHQVLYNLCHNAIKFAREGGKFVIKLKNLDSKRISISVYDDGQSISQEDLPMVFERFYKTDKSRGLDKSGVGLGLYICKTIIDAHDEQINVSSKEGEGTEFSFTLKKSK